MLSEYLANLVANAKMHLVDISKIKDPQAHTHTNFFSLFYFKRPGGLKPCAVVQRATDDY